ncbi:hypothetical protein [Oceanobacillus jordanicus]|uniref:DUF4625 domain-containing protein n=1 Tax=Oceanobacillus jordanicus TaxID=2867266 RepID=A0AAW5B6G6_9BACI|nr:hypothetical protein [Oceanobacillus jordanicus]MCG3419827.1 hypothetical protein [Oceanobacillus jordanicus]
MGRIFKCAQRLKVIRPSKAVEKIKNTKRTIFAGILFIFLLTGCFGEDYDVGVPAAHLQVGLQSLQTQLTEANVSWRSSSGEVDETIDNIEEFALEQNEIRVSPNQKASLEFKENEENGGDIWTDPTITASLWKNGKQTNINLKDNREFHFPTSEGNYVLEINFIDSANKAQYIGNIIIDKTSQQTEVTGGKLPKFTFMAMPTIKKINSDGLLFDNSYDEVCWNNCSDGSTYKYSEIHSGDVELGDKLLIEWSEMEPHPTEIYFHQIDTDNYNAIEKGEIDTNTASLEIEVGEENSNAQYAIEFLWKEGNEIVGKSMLNFRLE